MNTDTLRYAGTYPRVHAFLWDFVILLPVIGVNLWGYGHYRLFELYSVLPNTALFLFYHIYLVRRYGGTPGKLIVGLRIRKVGGASVGYREAILRYLPGALLSLAMAIAAVQGALLLTDAEFLAKPWSERHPLVTTAAPVGYQTLDWTNNLWMLGELVVFLGNRKRRALHDFIAGTVVVLADDNAVQMTPSSAVSLAPPPARADLP